ncbi:MAG TPA: hypothetical protein DEP07_01375 [Brevibacillus sp.]|nr:hypothetical protein [Brevibacillus sp.]
MILTFFKWLFATILIVEIPVMIYVHFVYGISLRLGGIGLLLIITYLLFAWDAKRTARRLGHR